MTFGKRFLRFFNEEPEYFKQPLRLLSRLYHFIRRVYQEFIRDNCPIRASGLAYSSLLALVPLAAFLFSLFTAFGSFKEITELVEGFIINQLIPTRQADLIAYLNQFIENSKTLGVVGLLLFAITSVSLLNSINANLNAVWGSPSRRSFVGKFAIYTSVIVVGSLLVSVSISISSNLRKYFSLRELANTNLFNQLLVRLSPSLFMFLAIVLMVILIPQGKVRAKSALIGGITGTLLWEFVRFWFLYLTNVVFRFSVIYGSIAFIPIFLFWIYLTWLIILISLEVTFVHQHKRKFWTGGSIAERPPAEKILFGLELYCYIAEQFLKGSPAPDTARLSREFSVIEEDIDSFLQLYLDKGFIHIIQEEPEGCIPARPLNRLPVKDLITALHGPTVPNPQAKEKLRKVLYKFNQAGYSALEGIMVEDLLQIQEKQLNQEK